MAKLENSLKNMVLSLTVIALVVGALLGWVASFTKAPIAATESKAQNDAITAVAPKGFDQVSEPVVVENCGNDLPATVFTVSKDGQPYGKAIEVVTKKGFGGKVKVMIGFDMQGNITGYNVLDCSQETPGLGAKMPEWFQEGAKGNVIGMNPGQKPLTVKQDGGDVDAITAATISSRAFCDAVALAWNVFNGSSDAVTSATAQADAAEAKPCCQGDCDPANCDKAEDEKCEKCKAAAAATNE